MIGLVDANNFYVSCERVFDRSLVGRPVAVLSNNDGCCVSRSNEFKALGIKMGTPYFQLKDREAAGELVFRSSNYELYGDMSRRIVSILRDEAVEVEQYSIDEAFITPPTSVRDGLSEYGARLREKILRWTGIPCGVGFAATKTLAKIANHIGKKLPGGVFEMPFGAAEILANLPVGEVWGVGGRLALKLGGCSIFTALDLANAPESLVRKVGGVVLSRTAAELRGEPCVGERDFDADPDSVSCSRTFGEHVATVEALCEAMASFVAQAAVKLRRHGMLASGCNLYVQAALPGMFADGANGWRGGFSGCTAIFPHPTDSTNEMLGAAREGVESLFAKGTEYRKAGVVFFGLEKAGVPCQLELFSDKANGASPLYKAVDAINAKLGAGKVFSASEGLGKKSWRMKREKLSKRATTNWNELLTVR